jgi:2-dehydropantoate 2-reductase
MLQDILGGKLTEIDMINGAVVREGEAAGIAVPVNRTLTNLIKFLQRSL